MGETTRHFRRRLDDQPVRVWTRRAVWFALGAAAALGYVAVMRLVLGPI